MAKVKKYEMRKILIDDVGIPHESLDLATMLCGDTSKVYEDILFIFTGYSTFESFVEEAAYEN